MSTCRQVRGEQHQQRERRDEGEFEDMMGTYRNKLDPVAAPELAKSGAFKDVDVLGLARAFEEASKGLVSASAQKMDQDAMNDMKMSSGKGQFSKEQENLLWNGGQLAKSTMAASSGNGSVCYQTMQDYLTQNQHGDKKAQFEPDACKTMEQIIKDFGYPYEQHVVTTADGYILTTVRIPHARKDNSQCTDKASKGPVLLGHGLVDSSDTWTMGNPGDSLGFVLADNCYDVWIMNDRGNFYSRGHVGKNLTYSDPHNAYWNFTWSMHSLYDMPANIEYVLKHTGVKSLSAYIGHSQGTSQGFAGFSTYHPELQDKVNLFIALAPVEVTRHIDVPIHGLAESVVKSNITRQIFDILGLNPFAPRFDFQNVTGKLCDSIPLLCQLTIAEVFWFAAGNHLDNYRIMTLIAHFPAGTSTNNMFHFAQMTMPNSIFQSYDLFSEEANWDYYCRLTPIAYNTSNLRIPTLVMSGTADKLADPADVSILMSPLNVLNETGHNWVRHVIYPTFGHGDFIWGVGDEVKEMQQTIMDNIEYWRHTERTWDQTVYNVKQPCQPKPTITTTAPTPTSTSTSTSTGKQSSDPGSGHPSHTLTSAGLLMALQCFLFVLFY
eukprot:Nk52_evm12s503 gene=Nk52_evmTU12s503